MEFKNILVERKDKVARLTINRPPYNVLDLATLREMNAALEELKGDKETKVVIVAGAGNKAFCAGVEVRDHIGANLPIMMEEFPRLFARLIQVDKPTIAVVNGVALGGGCELVAGCDMAIASDKSQFGQPEIKLGACPPAAMALFPRLMSHKKAFELILLGNTIDASEAERIGLINKAVPENELDRTVSMFVNSLLEKSGLVMKLVRRTMYQSFDLELTKAMDIIDDNATRIMMTEDGIEGLTSFLEKRKPVWKER